MKNQYFGDINDFRKFGLLRVFAAEMRIAVCWMLTGDDGRADGNLTGYLLDEASRLRALDPALFDTLKWLVHEEKKRHVQWAKAHALIPAAHYYLEPLHDQARERLRYFANFHPEADIVFFDPDNGMEVASTPRGRKDSGKYLYWDELARYYARGHSLLVYQHFRRMKREELIRATAAEMMARTNALEVYAFRTTQVAFFLVPQVAHMTRLHLLCHRVAAQWKSDFSVSRHWMAAETVQG